MVAAIGSQWVGASSEASCLSAEASVHSVVRIDTEAAAAGNLSFAVAFAAFAASPSLASSALAELSVYACSVENPYAEPAKVEEVQRRSAVDSEEPTKNAEAEEQLGHPEPVVGVLLVSFVEEHSARGPWP
jgi:hypothetical protein